MLDFQPQLNPKRFQAVHPAGIALQTRQAEPVVPLFGADRFTQRKKYVLIPSGTPIFFLHGTSSTGKNLNPLISWFQRDVRTDHPGYVSYMPEVENATGIDRVSNPKKQVPSSLLAIRDMGDFRCQVTARRLDELKRALAAAPDEDQALAEFFHLRPAEKDLLLPVIRRRILHPAEQVPPAWQKQYRQPLAGMAKHAVALVQAELAKMKLRPDERDMPVYDTEFLSTRADLEGRKANFDMNRPSPDKDVINIRPLHIRQVALFESYLMRMEQGLAEELASVFAAHARTPAEAQQRARLTAAKLMDAISPRLVAIGHSQGGTALMASLVNHVQTSPTDASAFDRQDPRRFEYLGGRAVGMNVLLSAPLSGIPELPAWGRKLLEKIGEIEAQIPLLRRKKGAIGEAVKRYVWHSRMKGKMAVREMRAGSDLARKFEAELPRLAGRGVTVISAFDKNDAYVEPIASQLRDKTGGHPDNVFNLEVETQQLYSFFHDTDDLLMEVLGMVPGLGPLAVKLIPKRLKREIQQFYDEEIVKVEQHRALITLPNAITESIGNKMMAAPENHALALKPDNFEPFRYQSLVARGKSFQRKCLDLPTPQAAAVLYEFTRQHPQFLSVLIENAREDLPVTNAASGPAQAILEKTLDLMARVVADPALKERYGHSLRQNLSLLAQADLPAFDTARPSLSQRAADLLKSLE